jgi:hypothetical protein
MHLHYRLNTAISPSDDQEADDTASPGGSESGMDIRCGFDHGIPSSIGRRTVRFPGMTSVSVGIGAYPYLSRRDMQHSPTFADLLALDTGVKSAVIVESRASSEGCKSDLDIEEIPSQREEPNALDVILDSALSQYPEADVAIGNWSLVTKYVSVCLFRINGIYPSDFARGLRCTAGR